MEIAVDGRIDTSTSAILRDAVSSLPEDISFVRIDLRDTPYISSAGLRELLICRKRFGESMEIINVTPAVMDIFTTTGFDSLLPIKQAEDDVSTYVHMSIEEFVDYKAQREGDKIAVTDPERSYTFAEIEMGSQIIAHDLAALGVKRGSHVAIMGRNSTRWIMTFFAIQKLEAMALLVNPGLSSAELDTVLKTGDTDLLCLSANVEASGIPIYRFEEGAHITERFCEYESIKEMYRDKFETDDAALIIFTSGSTGKPKGVLLSSYNVLNAASINAQDQTLTPSDSTCLILPLFHIFGLVAGLFANMMASSRLVIPKDIHTDTILSVIEREKCTFFHSVPTMLLALINNGDFKAERLATLRGTIISGAAATKAQIEQFQHCMPNNNFFSSYGLSEMAPVSITPYGDAHEHVTGTVGKPVRNIEITVKNGEILVQGFNLMVGYYKVPIEDQAIDEDGWLHTGDLGSIDDEGYLHLTGRLKELIIRGGENIMPGEIEAAISEMDNIANVKVIGVPSDFFGEEVIACIRTKEGASFDEEETRQRLLKKLAKFKIPSHFIVLDEFPMLSTGKIDVKTLKNRVKELLNIPS